MSRVIRSTSDALVVEYNCDGFELVGLLQKAEVGLEGSKRSGRVNTQRKNLNSQDFQAQEPALTTRSVQSHDKAPPPAPKNRVSVHLSAGIHNFS